MKHDEKEDKFKEAIRLGAQLLIENGLKDWKIKISNMRRYVARTYHNDKAIVFSKRFIIVSTKEQFIGVTLHEATHALLGGYKGHGVEFIELCTKISPTPLYAAHGAKVLMQTYIATCQRCGLTGGVDTDKGGTCGICLDDNVEVDFIIKRNEFNVVAW